MSKKEEVISRIENEIQSLKNKDFTMYFFTVDSRNVPNASTVYTYDIAMAFNKLGYKVAMLYQLENELSEKEREKMEKKNGGIDYDDPRIFVGVGEWLGDEFANLPHINIAKQGSWVVSPSDFLFIPEAFSGLMQQVSSHKIPCKCYVLLQNFDYVTDYIPLGSQWYNFGINEAIATTELQADMIKDVMPYVHTRILNPHIPEYFRNGVRPKELVVNIISKKQSDVNKLMKTFYWKFPMYRFISFKDLRGMNREHYAEQLKNGAITVWIDTETPFGFGALESLRCGCVTIMKMPENIQEWMFKSKNENDLRDGLIIFDNFMDLPDLLANVIKGWMEDKLSPIIYSTMDDVNKLYTKAEWDKNVEALGNDIVESRIKELELIKKDINDKEKKETK